MKRQQFRLGTVLKHYEVRKQRAEFELQQAARLLRDIDAEIARRDDELMALAYRVQMASATKLSTAGWLACYRQSDLVSRQLLAARDRRLKQQAVLDKLEEQRKRWAVAEESLLSLKREVAEHNQAESEKSQQLALDETVLRRWIGPEGETTPEA